MNNLEFKNTGKNEVLNKDEIVAKGIKHVAFQINLDNDKIEGLVYTTNTNTDGHYTYIVKTDLGYYELMEHLKSFDTDDEAYEALEYAILNNELLK